MHYDVAKIMEARPSFEDAVSGFRILLRESGWSDEILWLTADHITGHKHTFWIHGVSKMDSELATKKFYDNVVGSNASIRIDAFCRLGGKTLAYVENYGGIGNHLNYGIPESERTIRQIRSRIMWSLISSWNRIRGESSWGVHTDIPKRA